MTTRYIGGVDLQGKPVEFAVENGLFCEVGRADATISLGGKLVLPAYAESHCHVIPSGLDLLRLNLRDCQTRQDVLDAVTGAINMGEGWLHAVQYDQTKFEGATHLTRTELDRISDTRPILLRHSNGHAAVANTPALQTAKIGRDSPDPQGGTYVRDASGELTGVLLEHGMEAVSAAAPAPTDEELLEAVLRAGEVMAADGITVATDMMTGRWDIRRELAAYEKASRMGCKVRLRVYCQWSGLFGSRGIGTDQLMDLNTDGFRVCGAKLFSDGAIGSATAAIYGKYATTGESGQLIYPPELLKERIKRAHNAGLRVAVHAIGDRAVDVVLDAFEQTGDPAIHRLEHAMILSDAQIDRIKRVNPHVSMQPEFLIRFGHAYRAQIPDLFARLIRVRSMLDKGIRLSFSSDRPIVLGSPTDGIMTAVNRPEGFDPSENIELSEAVRLYTEAGTDSNQESIPVGQIKPGAHADWQVYDQPLKRDLKPVEVYKAGQLTSPKS